MIMLKTYLLDTERDKFNPLQNADDSFISPNTGSSEDTDSANNVDIE